MMIDRPRGPRVRRGLVGGVLAAFSVIGGWSAGDVLACDIAGPPSVTVNDLPAVLDRGSDVIDPGELGSDDLAQQVNGAVRIEVVEETPETERSYAGAVLQPTNVWGEATVPPTEVQEPVDKAKATNCDFNAPSLGTTYYYLSTTEGMGVTIVDTVGDSDIDPILDELFGPSIVVTDAARAGLSGTSTTVDEPGTGVGNESSPPLQLVGFGVALATVLVVGVAVGAWFLSAGRRRHTVD